MVEYCKVHNDLVDYQGYFEKWSDEEIANVALTLIHQTDRMLQSFLLSLEKQFIEQGGIREAMYKARMAGGTKK